jgi:UDPglucose 6-dehydrogenase
MNVGVIGTGYVGLVTGACLADFGHDVVCVDVDERRIAQLRQGDVPFFEPELREVVTRNLSRGRLAFTTDVNAAVQHGLAIFVAVGTPEGVAGSADLSQVVNAARAIGACMREYRVVVTKSTVPIGTARLVQEAVRSAMPTPVPFDVVSNPEFLREGAAVNDFLRPDRVVIGADNPPAAALVREIYRPLYLIETPMVVTDVATAEMIKYSSNACLAIKISYINEVANLCERVGADVHVVAKALGLDRRIGPKFLHPGPGFGGSCFPKDTRAFAATAREHGMTLRLVEAAIDVNEDQRAIVIEKIARGLPADGTAVIGVLGLSFKPNTSDVRESAAIHVCRALLKKGASIRAYDPVAGEPAQRELGSPPHFYLARDAEDAARGADAVVILTEWNEFRGIALDRLRAVMRGGWLVDARNVLDPAAAIAAGFSYQGIGRSAPRAHPSSAGTIS